MLDSGPSAGTAQCCELTIPVRNSAPVAIGSVVVGHWLRFVDFERARMMLGRNYARVAGRIDGIGLKVAASHGTAVAY